MKKTTRFLSVVLAVCLVLGLGAFASGEAADFAQVDETHWAGSSVTVTGVEYSELYADQDGSRYVDATLFGGVSKIFYDGGEVAVDSDVYTPILTVDGVQVDLYNIAEATTFTGDVVLTLVEAGDTSSNNGAPFGADKSTALFGPFRYTAAVYVADGRVDAAKSVEAARISGEVSDTEANGLTVDSDGDYFSAIYINNSDYVINDAVITLDGKCGDDFNGWGAGIVALGESNVEINRSKLYGTGVLRCNLYVSGTAVVNVNDSVVLAENDEDFVPYNLEDNYATPMMQQCPYALGIQGNIRSTMACGSGCNIFTGSLVASNGWAVLSTDSGRAGATALIANSMVAVVGEVSEDASELEDYDFSWEVNGEEYFVNVGRQGEMSGYIAYADSGVLDFAYGSAWYSPDYLGIITSGAITMADGCYGYSDRIGFLLHAGGGTSGTGTLTVSDSSFDIRDIFAVSQAAGTYVSNITLTNADIALANEGKDILFLQCDTDDHSGSPGDTSNTITDITYDEYLALDVSANGAASTLTITDSHVQGNVYNSATGGSGIDVVLDNSELDGAISSAFARHTDAEGNLLDETEFYCDYYTGTTDGADGAWDYTMYLRVAVEPAETRANPVSLTMTNGAIWMVTGENYLTSLSFDDTCSIKGMSITFTVNGVETELEPGTYEGEIVLTAGESPSRGEGGPELKAPVIGDAVAIETEESETAAAAADLTLEPFNVDVGDGMVLEFTSVQYALGDGMISILIPDTSKQIDCEIVDGEWVFADADFVDQAIIEAAKALYEEAGGAEAAAAGDGAFAADATIEPFNVDVGEGMILEFTGVQYDFGEGTVSLLIPDTSKQIDCEIVDGEWVFADADFVDQAIIDTAKALYESEGGEAAPAAEKSDGFTIGGTVFASIGEFLNSIGL